MQWVAVLVASLFLALYVNERFRFNRVSREAERLFDAAPVSMTVLNQEGLLRANDRLLSVFGLEAGGASTERLRELLSDESVNQVMHLVEQVIESGDRFEIPDGSVLSKDGRVINCDLVATPVRWRGHDAVQIAYFPVGGKLAARIALRESEERLSRFFSEIPVPMYRTRFDGAIVSANPALLGMLEVDDVETLRGRNASDFYADPSERRSTVDDDSLDDRLFRMRTSTGRELWVRDLNHVVADEDGDAFEGVIIDVSREQEYLAELERRARQHQALAEIAHEALRHTDAGKVLAEAAKVVANVLDAGCVLIAQPHGELGLLATAAAYGVDSARERELLHDYLARHIDEIPETRTAVEFPVESRVDGAPLSGMQIAISGPEMAFGVIGVTGRGFRPSAEDRDFLSALSATLGSAISRCRSRDRMDQLMRSKDEFIASVSHELRTPLTVVAGLSLELERRWNEFSGDELDEFITLIADQSREMGDLIEDLLVAARADIGKVPITLEEVDLRTGVDHVMAGLRLVDRTRITVSGEGVSSPLDPVRYRQVIRNLVTNSIRYGGPNVHISISERNGSALVAVFDDGPGIAEDDRDRIFAAYEKAHPAARVPGSVGLGLTVSRKLTEMMNGSISYRYDGGSYFELTFPLAGVDGGASSQGDTTPLLNQS